MTSFHRLSSIVLAASFVAAFSLRSADLFDPAGELQVSSWIKGGPVDIKAGRGTNVYVVEFWATWCGPCRTSIPHLTEMQKKFKDQNVTFIGISDEDADKVKPFVDKMGERMNYAVALDKDGRTSTAFMQKFGQGGIPTAFIVNQKGEVAWYGHPMGGLEQVLPKIISGKYDKETARKEKEAEEARERRGQELNRAFNEYMQMVMAEELSEKAAGLGRKLIKDAGTDAGVLYQISWILLTNEGIKHRDIPLAKEAALAAAKYSDNKQPVVLDALARAHADSGEWAEAIEVQKKAVAIAENDEMKNAMSETLKKYEGKSVKTGRK